VAFFYQNINKIIWACPKGRAVHCIFCFAKEAKQKDAISIPHATSRFQKQFCFKTRKTAQKRAVSPKIQGYPKTYPLISCC
jgi:hypothetical protein